MIVGESAASACPVQAVDLVLIDDDKLTLEIVAWILRDTDFSHKLFIDHFIAAKCLEVVKPRMLIVDLFMPRINGIEFLQELEKSQNLMQTRLFLCSAIAPRSHEMKLMKKMGVEVLDKQKICNKVQLHNLLKMNLSNHIAPDSAYHQPG